MTEFLERLRCDVEATRTALAMVEAVHQHLTDALTDDPGDFDEGVVPLLNDAERYADALRLVLRRLTEGRQP